MVRDVTPKACDPYSRETLDTLISLAIPYAGHTEREARYLIDKLDKIVKNGQWPKMLKSDPRTWERFCLEVLGYEAQYFEEIREGIAVLERRGHTNPTVNEAQTAGAMSTQERVQKAAQKTTGEVRQRGGDQKSEERKSNDKLSNDQQDNRALQNGVGVVTQRKLDQLACQRPDLHEQVKAGTRSVDAAYREAKGKPKSVSILLNPDSAIRSLIKHFTYTELAAIVRGLAEPAGLIVSQVEPERIL